MPYVTRDTLPSVITLCTLFIFRPITTLIFTDSPNTYNVLKYITQYQTYWSLNSLGVFRLFALVLWLFVSLLLLFSLAARKDVITETVYVASPAIQSKKNGWFEGSCGMNWRVDFVSTKTAISS